VYQLYISTRMRRGVPGPPGNSRAAISTKSTKATNAKSESTILLHGAGAKTSIGPNRISEYSVSNRSTSPL
jgi:hypothetical protein